MTAERHDVVWPSAPLQKGEQHTGGFAARAGDLTGRRVGFIWDYVFSGDVMFEEIQRELEARYADISFVGHAVYGNTHGHDEEAVLERLPELLRSTEVDSVILGVGA